MKRILVTAVIIFSAFLSVLAQQSPDTYLPKPRFSIGPEFAIPTNNGFARLFRSGFGGSGALEIPVTRQLYIQGIAGFITYYLKSSVMNLTTINKSYIPLKAGGKYYIKNSFYAEGAIGASIGTQKNAGTAFVWTPGIGTSLPVTKNGYLDIGVRYEEWARSGGNLNQFGLRAAYKF